MVQLSRLWDIKIASSTTLPFSRPASLQTSSQPKSIAVGGDGSVFLAENDGLEVIRDNQKAFKLSTSFTPSAIDVHDSLVAAGGEVGDSHIHALN